MQDEISSITFNGTVIYISYCDFVLSLKMAFVAETYCWWLLIDKLVFSLDLQLFYLLVFLNTMGMPCLKKTPSLCLTSMVEKVLLSK